MNILFYKLLARNELKKQADYILKHAYIDTVIKEMVSQYGYDPIEKLKELEDDIDAQVLTPELYDFMICNKACKEDDIFGYIKELYDLVDRRFKSYGLYITNQIKEYLLTKKINTEWSSDETQAIDMFQ